MKLLKRTHIPTLKRYNTKHIINKNYLQTYNVKIVVARHWFDRSVQRDHPTPQFNTTEKKKEKKHSLQQTPIPQWQTQDSINLFSRIPTAFPWLTVCSYLYIQQHAQAQCSTVSVTPHTALFSLCDSYSHVVLTVPRRSEHVTKSVESSWM
jgi:hypothetical protein